MTTIQSDHEIEQRAARATTVIKEAGDLALKFFADLENLAVDEKQNGQDVVSAADKAVETLIRAAILEHYPQDGLLGEEEGLQSGSNSYTWVIDPIDGTSCFVNGLKDWCISIALLRGDETILGLIYQPLTDELFSATLGKGAFLNERRISANSNASLQSGLLGVGANFRVPHHLIVSFLERLLNAGGMFIRSGSGALMLAHVACGRLVGYYEPHINSWDCLAGLLIIREADGVTGEFPIPEKLLTGHPVIAAGPKAAKELFQLIEASQQA